MGFVLVSLFFLALAVLLAACLHGLHDMAGAIKYPFRLDYGEGIVWQQTRMMFDGTGYRPMTPESLVVFHYPPMFHIVSGLFARTVEWDWLVAARTVTATATLITSFLVGGFVFSALRCRYAVATAALSGLMATLLVFVLFPITVWSAFARVDMLAVSLSLLGALLGLRALRRPGWLYLSMFCFVAALFTKQIMVSAPLATFTLLFAIRPAVAWRGLLIAFFLGCGGLGLMHVATEGAFWQHLLAYNINTFSPAKLMIIVSVIAVQLPLLVVVVVTVSDFARQFAGDVRRLAAGIVLYNGPEHSDFDYISARLFAVIWFGVTAITSLAVFKTGSSVNYLVEWLLCWSVLVGLAIAPACRCVLSKLSSRFGAEKCAIHHISAKNHLWYATIFACLVVQAFLLPRTPFQGRFGDAQHQEALWKLVSEIRDANGPVVSDDMVLLQRAGKQVVWEPAIVNELIRTGQLDDEPLVKMIRERRFAFFLSENIKRRFPANIVQSIALHYPRIVLAAGYRLHYPASPP